MYHLLSIIDWSDMYCLKEPELILKLFYNTIYEVFNDCVPLKRTNGIPKKYSYPVWFTVDIIKDIKLKHHLHKRYKSINLRSDYEAFAHCRARVKAETREAHDLYCDRVQNHIAKEPRTFWDYVRSRKTTKSGKQSLVQNGRYLSQLECASEFARYFQSVYNQEPPALSVSAASAAPAPPPGARVHLAPLQESDVRRALTRLPPKRSTGPDGIPPYIFRDCSKVLAKPLLHLFNRCIETATFPEHWKLSRVVPVPKGSGGSTSSEYRPVAVLCTPAKVFEMAIHNQLYVEISSQLSDSQHGFRPGRGTTGNLLHLMARLVPAVDAGVQVDVAYFDFRKAFDTVDNDVLLFKLANLGFSPHTLAFFASYLRNRRQYVDYGGHLSEPYFTRSGISQGSSLGPLLFIIMINDLPDVVNGSTPLLYADDLKLILEVKNSADHEILQQDIDRIVRWSLENKLLFNVDKCSVVSFSRARVPNLHRYTMDGAQLQRVDEVKDLGVRFTANLNFRKHIIEICKKAYRNLGFILRQANSFTNLGALRALFEALVKSHLECNAAIWSPHEAKYKYMLERIQNKFLRFLYLKEFGVYPGYPLLYPTLFILGMVGYSSLETRREVALATYLFKVIRGVIPNSAILQEIRLCVPDRCVGRRRSPPLLQVPRARTKLLEQAPLTRALRVLNTIAAQTDVFSCSLNEFMKATYSIFCVTE